MLSLNELILWKQADKIYESKEIPDDMLKSVYIFT